MYLEKPKLFGLIKTCCYCGDKYLKYKNNGWGCCEDCYSNKELMVCRDCGIEISKFDFDDYRGLCTNCYDETDITICLDCGREYIRTDYSKGLVCPKCEVE